MRLAGAFVIGIIATIWVIPDGHLNAEDLSRVQKLLTGALTIAVCISFWKDIRKP